MKARSNGLVLSTSSAFGLEIVAGFRMCLAGTTYFSFLLSASLLTSRYTSRTPGVASEILIGFNFFDFLTFEALQEPLH